MGNNPLTDKLIITHQELAFQILEKDKRAAELTLANNQLAFQYLENRKRENELSSANREIVFQNHQKEKRAKELLHANKEMAFQITENEKRADELQIANKELSLQNLEIEKHAANLIVVNTELELEKEKFRLVVESAHNAIVLIDNKGIITLINRQTEILFGYNRAELLDHNLEMLVPGRFREHYRLHSKEFLSETQARDMGAGREIFSLAKDNTEIPVEIVLNPIETSDGHRVLITIIDITEHKFHEAMLEKQNLELEQFAYLASHDLQEPLRTIANFMTMFEEEYLDVLDETALTYLKSVHNTASRMGKMIKSLLDFSRLNNNKKPVTVNLKTLVNEVIADLDNLIRKSGTNIEVSEMPELKVYEAEMRQLFQNIIANAIKFGPKDVPPEIKISTEKINGKWKFSVTDNGIGIAHANYQRVFEIFKSLNTNGKYSGNGIGLAKCRKIVQMHKGEIWIESTVGKGTTFYFTIPISIP